MKKLSLFIICLLLVVGCGEKENLKKNQDSSSITTTTTKATTSKVSDTTKVTTTTSKVSDTTKVTTTTTKKKSSTTKSTTSTTKEVIKNMYKSSYDQKEHKYTYVYNTLDSCKSAGNKIFFDIVDNVNSKVMVFDCEKVYDSNNKEYYGLFFNTAPSDDARFYY